MSSQGRNVVSGSYATHPWRAQIQFELHLLECGSNAPSTGQDDCIPGFGQRCDHPEQSSRDWCRVLSRTERVTRVVVMASPITALCDSRARACVCVCVCVCDLHEDEEPHVLIEFIKGVCM